MPEGPQVAFLGGCRLYAPDGARVDLRTRKAWGLLAYLGQSHGRDVPREELAALLWPRGGDGQGRASLRQELAVLRKGLDAAGVTGLRGTRDTVRLVAARGQIDTVELERALDLRDLDAWRRAVRLYRGEFLAGLDLRAVPFEEWVWMERQRLRNRILGALGALLDADVAGDTPDRAFATAEAMLAIEPAQEAAYRTLMDLLHRAGRGAEALTLYARCVDVMRRDLDTAPSRETAALADRIRHGAVPEQDAIAVPSPERRVLAVLCATWCGTRDLDALRDPDLALLAQTAAARRIAPVVGAAGGRLLPLQGDRAVAVFGTRAGTRGKPPAAAAIDAALELAETPLPLTAHTELWLRVGLAQGEVLYAAAPVGRGAGGLTGAALHRASRLSMQARRGQVLAGRDVTGGLRGQAHVLEPPATHRGPAEVPAMAIRRRSETPAAPG